MKKLFLAILIAVIMFSSQAGSASEKTLRCRSRLVYIGDSRSDVLDKCGQPDQVAHWEEDHNSWVSQLYDYRNERYQAPKLTKGPIPVERWTYDFGSNKFIVYLHFENDRLIRIETGQKGAMDESDYGEGPSAHTGEETP